MKEFKVKVSEQYSYEIKIKAKNQREAIRKTKELYNNPDESPYYGILGVADACSFEKVNFRIIKE